MSIFLNSDFADVNNFTHLDLWFAVARHNVQCGKIKIRTKQGVPPQTNITVTQSVAWRDQPITTAIELLFKLEVEYHFWV